MEDLPAKPQPKDPYAQARALGRELARAANVPQAKRKVAGSKGKRGGARRGAGHPKGVPSPNSGRKAAVPGDPRRIKINVAINNAEAAALDAKAAAAGLTRLDMIRALISM